MTATEFLRFCDRDDVPPRAELINGVIRIMSPISYGYHSNPHGNLLAWLGFYSCLTPGVELAAPSSLRLDEDNVPEPDGLLRIPSNAGGQSRIAPGNYLEGAPELVAEIAGTSAAFDLHDKLELYRRHGVREYIVWRARNDAIDWFVLHEGRFERLELPADRCYKSEVFPGLWMDVDALIRGDLAAVFQAVKRGTETTPQHAEFLQRLNKR